jgi:hypothetical protein
MDRSRGPLALQDFRQDLFLEYGDLRWIAKEARFVGCNDLEELGEFLLAVRIELEKIVILVEIFEIELPQAVGEAVFQEIFAVFSNIDAALLIDEVTEIAEGLVVDASFPL